MSIHTTFPDAIVFPDGTIRLVTSAAKLWAYSNTEVKNSCTDKTVPDYVDFEDSIPQMMEDDELVVKRELQPVFHYRSKRRTSKNKRAANDSEDDYDGHRARFEGLMQETDGRREKSDEPEEKRDEI